MNKLAFLLVAGTLVVTLCMNSPVSAVHASWASLRETESVDISVRLLSYEMTMKGRSDVRARLRSNTNNTSGSGGSNNATTISTSAPVDSSAPALTTTAAPSTTATPVPTCQSFTIAQVSPGPVKGGKILTVTGTGLNAVNECNISVRFGTNAKQTLTAVSSTVATIPCTDGACRAVNGTVLVFESVQGTRSFNYVTEMPELVSLNPNYGVEQTPLTLNVSNYGYCGMSHAARVLLKPSGSAATLSINVNNSQFCSSQSMYDVLTLSAPANSESGVYTASLKVAGVEVSTGKTFTYTFAVKMTQVVEVNINLNNASEVESFKSSYASAVATSLNLNPNEVEILSITAVTASRRLLQSGVQVEFRIISASVLTAAEQESFVSNNVAAVTQASNEIATALRQNLEATMGRTVVVAVQPPVVVVSGTTNPAQTPAPAPVPAPPYEVGVGFPAWATFLIVLGCLLVVAGGAVVLFKRRMNVATRGRSIGQMMTARPAGTGSVTGTSSQV